MPRRQGENRVKVYIEIYRARFLTDNAGRSPFSASKCGGKSLYSLIKNLGWFLPEHKWRMKRVLKEASMIALTRLSTDNAGKSPFSTLKQSHSGFDFKILNGKRSALSSSVGPRTIFLSEVTSPRTIRFNSQRSGHSSAV